MSSTKAASNTNARTQTLQANGHSYAYRRFGNGSGLPLLFLQHFTGTLDNWDPAVTDPLASGREVILFDNAGLGRSTGEVQHTVGPIGPGPDGDCSGSTRGGGRCGPLEGGRRHDRRVVRTAPDERQGHQGIR